MKDATRVAREGTFPSSPPAPLVPMADPSGTVVLSHSGEVVSTVVPPSGSEGLQARRCFCGGRAWCLSASTSLGFLVPKCGEGEPLGRGQGDESVIVPRCPFERAQWRPCVDGFATSATPGSSTPSAKRVALAMLLAPTVGTTLE
jgi:hypothetical protein